MLIRIRFYPIGASSVYDTAQAEFINAMIPKISHVTADGPLNVTGGSEYRRHLPCARSPVLYLSLMR